MKKKEDWKLVPRSVLARELAHAIAQIEKAWVKVLTRQEGSVSWYRAKMRVDFYVHRKNTLLKELQSRGEVTDVK